MKSILIGAIAAFVLVLAASSALALGPGYGRGTNDRNGNCACRVSDLTPEQVTKIQTIRQANLKEVSPLRQQLLAKNIELKSLWLAKDPDQSKISALHKDALEL